MKKTIVVKGKSAPKKTVRKPFRKNDANKLSVCSIKGTCPIADVYNCQFTYGGYDPLTMSAIGLYTGQYIWGANNIYDPIQSGGGNQPYYYDQLIAPTSGVTGLYKSWKVSGSKIELEFCAAGSNTVPVYVWLLPVSSDNASLPTNPPTSTSILAQSASPSLPAVDLQTAQKITNYLPTSTTTSPGTTGMSTITVVSRSLQLWTSEVDLLVHHRQTC